MAIPDEAFLSFEDRVRRNRVYKHAQEQRQKYFDTITGEEVTKSGKPKKRKAAQSRKSRAAKQTQQLKEWRAAWHDYANHLWSSAWWPEGAGGLIPARDRADYHIDALARRSGRLKATDREIQTRCGSGDTTLRTVQQALREAVRRGEERAQILALPGRA